MMGFQRHLPTFQPPANALFLRLEDLEVSLSKKRQKAARLRAISNAIPTLPTGCVQPPHTPLYPFGVLGPFMGPAPVGVSVHGLTSRKRLPVACERHRRLPSAISQRGGEHTCSPGRSAYMQSCHPKPACA
jgi:hypothetical protein